MKKYSYTESEATEFAKVASKTVFIRTYSKSNSDDTEKESTEEEAKLVERAIASALYAILAGHDENSAKATCEHFILYDSKETHINSYLTAYLKINEFLASKSQ